MIECSALFEFYLLPFIWCLNHSPSDPRHFTKNHVLCDEVANASEPSSGCCYLQTRWQMASRIATTQEVPFNIIQRLTRKLRVDNIALDRQLFHTFCVVFLKKGLIQWVECSISRFPQTEMNSMSQSCLVTVLHYVI